MPLFDFNCANCDETIELLVRGREEPSCPRCGGRLDRQLPLFAVRSGSARSASSPAPGSCGTCGDPRGPGSCSLPG